MTSSDQTLLKAALWYAKHGWAVHPLRRHDKIPTQTKWQKRATDDVIAVGEWWTRTPEANIGLAPGNCGLVVIDVDEESMESWRDLVGEVREAHGVNLEDTVIDETPGGGLHVFYRANGRAVSTGKIRDVIEVKAQGGNIVLPPSMHPAGGTYGWAMNCGPHEREVADLPACLARMLPGRRRAKAMLPPGSDRMTLTWNEILQPHGWEPVRTDQQGKTYWRRPGVDKHGGHSATTKFDQRDLLFVFSENAVPFEAEQSYNKLAAYAVLNCEGDVGAAMEDLGIALDDEGTQGDYGHAAVLATKWKGVYRWATHLGAWMLWTSQVWQAVPEERVVKEASDALRAEYLDRLSDTKEKSEIDALGRAIGQACTRARIIAVLGFLKGWPTVLTLPEEWDAEPWQLNCENGVLHLDTHVLDPHSPDQLHTKLVHAEYDPEAQGPNWGAHIARFIPNKRVRRQVRRDLGSAMVGGTLEERLPIWYGTGANGKSTTSTVIQNLLGKYAQRAAPDLLVKSRGDRHPTEVADLAGSRVVFSIEADEGKRLAEALVKDLTGGDIKKARYMRQDFFEFKQTFTIFLLVNHKPVITGTDEGIWRRVNLIPFTYKIPDAEKRPQDEVIAELGTENSAILNWLVAGLDDWNADRRWKAPEVIQATANYREEQDALAGFLEACCEFKPTYEVTVKGLYGAYTQWCERGGERALSKRRVGDLLEQRGCPRQRNNKARVFVGVHLTNRHQTTMADSLERQEPPPPEQRAFRDEADEEIPF